MIPMPTDLSYSSRQGALSIVPAQLRGARSRSRRVEGSKDSTVINALTTLAVAIKNNK